MVERWQDIRQPAISRAAPLNRARSPFSLLIVVIAAGLLMTWVQNRAPAPGTNGVDSSSRAVDHCPESVQNDCAESVVVPRAPGDAVLRSTDVCVDVGYLCAQVEARGSARILRWPKDTKRLRIRVPLPAGVAPARARELRSAVVRGLQYWHRRPFELVIDTHPTALEEADIEISWGGLSGNQLGRTEFTWANGEFEVQAFALAVRSPGSRYELPPEQVLLTAAHEMGHALGLPHSDSERDVMYPTNTAHSLTTRDFRTLHALYELPIGALIERDQ